MTDDNETPRDAEESTAVRAVLAGMRARTPDPDPDPGRRLDEEIAAAEEAGDYRALSGLNAQKLAAIRRGDYDRGSES